MLTSCLQAEIFSDLLVVTWMGEVKYAVASEVHLEEHNKNENSRKQSNPGKKIIKKNKIYIYIYNVFQKCMFWISIDLPVPAVAEAAVFNIFLDKFLQVIQTLTPSTEKVPPFLGCSLNKKIQIN